MFLTGLQTNGDQPHTLDDLDPDFFNSVLDNDNMEFDFEHDGSFWPGSPAVSVTRLGSVSSTQSFIPPYSGSIATERKDQTVAPVLPPEMFNVLMELVIALRTSSANLKSQVGTNEDAWLRDDNAVFVSLNSLCGVVEQIVTDLQRCEVNLSEGKVFQVLSQAQMGFYFTQEACNHIVDALHSAVSKAKSMHFCESSRQQDDGSKQSWQGLVTVTSQHDHSTLALSPDAKDDKVDLVDVLAERLQHTVHLTASSFQVGRLLTLLERIIEFIQTKSEADKFSMSSFSVLDMKTNCIKLRSLMHVMQMMIDALKVPMRY